MLDWANLFYDENLLGHDVYVLIYYGVLENKVCDPRLQAGQFSGKLTI
jgi:hypothetical protein